jgi:two-component system, NarL family, nitrate/nitrite response regulator NarL
MVLAVVMEPNTPVRALALGDLARCRGTFDALAGDPGLVVERGSASDAPDVVVLVTERGVAARRAVEARSAHPSAKLVVLVDREDARVVGELMRAGACGILIGEVDAPRLRDAILRGAAGEIVVPDHHLASLVSSVDPGRAQARGEILERLTAREREILRSLAGGRSTAQIASDLGISTLTVQTHLKSILAKLGVHSKIEAITLAWRDGLAPVPTSA